MQISRIRWAALIAALLVLVLGYAMLTRTVTVMADGRLTVINTRALTVGGALKAAGVLISSQDIVEPSKWGFVQDGMIINVIRATRIELMADGKNYVAITSERNPDALLSMFGLKRNDGDRLLVNGKTLKPGEELPQGPYFSLELRRPVSIRIAAGSETLEFPSSAATLGEALAEQGIDLFSSDQLNPTPDTPLGASVDAVLTRAERLTIVIGENSISVRTAATFVGQALTDAGVSLQGLDRSEPDAQQPIPEDRNIRVIRVNEIVQLEQQNLPHEVEWQEDSNANLDSISVIQAGQDGVISSRTRTRYEDGEEVSQIEEEGRTLVEAKDQINGYGTKIALQTATIDGVTIEYYRAVSVFTTWYSPCNSGTSTCLNGTSSGMPVAKGTIATYLSWYRALKGTTVYIPGYGYAAFGDVGAYPSGEPWIDLAFSEADVAAANGVPWTNQYVTIYFTTPQPSYIPLVWPPG